ncbi:hypothetical protein [Lacisediminihabitans sp.]|uniref:hypothetical protein n=1 Tax=Lacisediminihabitans sp. TaxID=2787631 RepID=UPI00374DCC05
MSDDSTQPSSPFASRGFIAAAIVIGVILLAGVIVLVTALTAPHDPVAKPTSSPSSPVASGDDKSVCGLQGFETESSLTAAPATKWELVGTVAAPTDPSGAGPGRDDAGLRTCYAHTAEGALFAAVGYLAVGSDARNVPRLYELLADGPVRDELQATPSPGDASSDRLQVAGFKINAYSASEATVDVAWQVTSSGSQLVSFPTVLRWEHGDWKVVIDKNGPPFAPSPLTSLGGYTPWAGV